MLTYDDISEMTGVAKPTLYVWRMRGRLPAPDLELNARTPVWKPETIKEWMNAEGITEPDRGRGQ
jgi:predicted DNA-binding transcriptional regulator AlpA